MTLKENDPYLSVMQSYEEPDTGRRILRNVLIKPLQVTPDNLNNVRGMIARLSMQAFNKPIQLVVLDTIFRNELKKNQIELAFRLMMKKGQTIPEAIFPGKQQYLFRRMAVPALVSVLLILLSVGSLYTWDRSSADLSGSTAQKTILSTISPTNYARPSRS